MTPTITFTALVVGATGATGRHVVKMMLDQGHNVKVIVRSKDRMLSLLGAETDEQEDKYRSLLSITEASFLDLTDDDIQAHVDGCDAVISCLGHTLDRAGLFGRKSRRLVTNATKKLTKAITKSNSDAKFILMGSDGVAHPDGTTDVRRPMLERFVVFLLRNLITPQADNEEAAAYLYHKCKNVPWAVVRPTDLIDGDATGEYDLTEATRGSLFGDGVATRANVAHFMVRLVKDDATWRQYKHKMPVLYDLVKSDKTSGRKAKK